MNKETIEKYFNDPVLFVRDAFGVNPTKQQAKILNNCFQYGSRLTIASGHTTGKTTCLAWIMHWFLNFNKSFGFPKIIITSPTKSHLYDVNFQEFLKWYNKYQVQEFKNNISIDTKNHTISSDNKIGLFLTYEGFIEMTQNINDQSLEMILIDEASGVSDELFNIIEDKFKFSNIVLTGIPTRNEGFFYDTHHNLDIKNEWKQFNFSSEDSENVSKNYCNKMAEKYGVNSDYYKIRVLGEFISKGENNTSK